MTGLNEFATTEARSKGAVLKAIQAIFAILVELANSLVLLKRNALKKLGAETRAVLRIFAAASFVLWSAVAEDLKSPALTSTIADDLPRADIGQG
ncbi:MAG: hypothetical protein HY785_19020 [Oscillatoriophycideae cyanobacterium NC_groundwater_1537_Pr4_S-0.65um_50_18]|nr:hypothetical protein [Oscillatoriophycideae cyanobacterium NC_groundwater_1537_Pr4_S-0.65um_50_18]